LTSPSSGEEIVARRLAELGIAVERHEHPPVATVEAAEQQVGIDATHCKNLFLRNQKVPALPRHPRASKEGRSAEGGRSDRRRQAQLRSPERLKTHLGLTPGSVSPFGLINDASHAVRIVLDRDLKSAVRLSFHPNINTVTYVVSAADFTRFLEVCGNPVQHVTV
jgi:Ala-tRNA(Pro) deacylase